VPYFLAKTEPSTYSFSQLQKEKKTVWDGIRNAQALKAIKSMKPGDTVFMYHSGGESSIVGLARVRSLPRPDPKDPKLTVVDLEAAGPLEPPVTLKEIKETGLFNDWALVRQGRLSTMAAPDSFVAWLRKQRPKLKL
jgi:predicted RNA-binding protein with PUA-like domain